MAQVSEMKATPRNPYLGLLADVIQGADGFIRQPFGLNNPPASLLSDALGIPAIGRTVDRMSYGEPLTTGKGWTTKARPDTAEALMSAPVAPKAALGVASMGLGASGADKAIFIGANAKTWNKANADKFVKLEKQGLSNREAYAQTGTFRSPDRLLRQEIDDSAALYNPYGFKERDNYAFGKYAGKSSESALPGILKHQELFDSYPDVSSVVVRDTSLRPTLRSAGSGEYHEGLDRIGLAQYLPDAAQGVEGKLAAVAAEKLNRATLLHEVQHAIQGRENFARGGNLSDAPRVYGSSNYIKNRLKAIERKFDEVPYQGEEYQRLVRDYERLTKQEEAEAAMTGYRRLAGEAESRAVEARMNYTPEQRRSIFPLDDYDVPVDQLIVRGQSNGPAMAIDPKAQKKLVEALKSGGSDSRYRLGDITRKQADEIDAANGTRPRGLLDVYVSPQVGERHVFGGRVSEDGFSPSEVGLFAKQAMRPDSEALPPFKGGDYGLLASREMLDPVSRRTYSAQMPLASAEDGFELISVIPKGLQKRKPPKP